MGSVVAEVADTSLIGRLNEVVSELGAEDARFLPASAQQEDLIELQRAAERLNAVLVDRIHVLDKTQAYATDGSLSAQAWLRHRCNMSPQAAAQRVKVGRQLAELPETREAFAGGEISYDHAVVIANSAVEVGMEIARDAQQHLLPLAREVDPRRLGMATSRLKHCVDPDGYLEDANRLYARRYVHLSETMDGVFYLKGMLDAEGGTMLRTALEPLMKPTPDDQRTILQRRADAVVELSRRQLDGGQLPEVGGHKPHLAVIVQQQSLAHLPGSGPAELEGGQSLAAEAARRIACDCSRSWVTVGQGSELLAIEGPTQVIPSPLRRALVMRDRTCRFPVCDRPAWMCDAHHMVAWEDGGKTVLGNLILCCRTHHRKVHEEGWKLIWGADGEVLAIPPPWAEEGGGAGRPDEGWRPSRPPRLSRAERHLQWRAEAPP